MQLYPYKYLNKNIHLQYIALIKTPNTHRKLYIHFSNMRLAFQLLSLFVLLQVIIQEGVAYEFKVGGFNGWMPPSDPNTNTFNQWAEKNRFQIGDSLVFVYSANKDSLLYVTQNDYHNCNTSNPIHKFTDGRTVFNLDHSGSYYFISGVKDNCLKNEKMMLIVLADRSKNAPAPAPESVTAAAPSPSNTTASSPSPAQAGESPPSPPPTGSTEINPTPTPAPSSDESKPKKNGSSSTGKNFFVLLAAFVGLSALSV